MKNKQLTQSELVDLLRNISEQIDNTKEVLLPDDIKAGYHNISQLIHFIADMIE